MISETGSEYGTLREKVVLASARSFNWSPLEKHLDEISTNQDVASRIVSLLRRCNDFLIKRPNTQNTNKRKIFIDSLQRYFSKNVGSQAADLLSTEIATILQIEAGYEEILRALESTEASKRWSRIFGPVVKVDCMTKEVIPNDKTKEPFARFQSQGCA